MSQEGQYYSLVPYGYGQVPFPSQLCELNLHRADEGLDIGSFTDTGNLPTSESPIIQPGSPNFVQPWVQQTNERHQEKGVYCSDYSLYTNHHLLVELDKICGASYKIIILYSN